VSPILCGPILGMDNPTLSGYFILKEFKYEDKYQFYLDVKANIMVARDYEMPRYIHMVET
jgi:hypothetical protein